MSKERAIAEWRRARESLGAASTYEQGRYYADAISRSYYAVMHASKAALQLYDVDVNRHRALGGLFGQHIVNRNLLQAELSREIGRLSELRNDADYEVEMVFGEADARAAYQRAAAFLDRIRALLTDHISPEELEPG